MTPGAPGTAAPSGGAARAPRVLWDRWLGVGVALVAVLGVALVAAAGPAADVFDQLFFGGDGPVGTPDGRSYVAFVYRVLGAVLLGWAVSLGVLARQLRARRRETWRAVVGSVLAWFVVDTTASLLSGFGANAALNLGLLVVLAVPLAGTARELT